MEKLQQELDTIISNFEREVDLLSLVKGELSDDLTYRDEGHRNHIKAQIDQAKNIVGELEMFKNHFNDLAEEISSKEVEFE